MVRWTGGARGKKKRVHKFVDVGNEDLDTLQSQSQQTSSQQNQSSTQDSNTTTTTTTNGASENTSSKEETSSNHDDLAAAGNSVPEDWSTQATQAAPGTTVKSTKKSSSSSSKVSSHHSSLSHTHSYRLKMEKAMAAAAVTSYPDHDDDTLSKAEKGTSLLTANDLAAGQLMRWKMEAEQGPCLLQSLATLCSLAGMATTLYPVILIPDYWQYPTWMVAFHTVNLCSLILLFEWKMGPLRAKALVARYLNMLRLLWGRGLLYIFAGTMNVAVGWKWALYSGMALVVTGLLAIVVGARASFNLDRLKASVTDEVYLWTKFDAVDDDGDELIGVDAFSTLVWSLGLEINDKYTYETFVSIDKDHDKLISFDDFKDWWFAGQEKNRNGGCVRRIIL